MKRFFTIPSIITLLILVIQPLKAQEDLVEFFPAGQADAELLIDGYLSTMGEVIGSGINNGWYTNGAPHSKLGIEFNVTFNTVFIPSEDDFFATPSLTNTTYDHLEEVDFLTGNVTIDNNPTQVPSIYGPVGSFPVFGYASGNVNETGTDQLGLRVPALFKGPDGNSLKAQFQINAVVVPTMQLGIGIIKNTDLKLRYTPELDFDGTKFGTWGVGVMHSIKDHIPGLKLAPIGWSLLVAYSRMNGEVDLSGQWDGPGGTTAAGGDPGHLGEFTVNGFTIQTIVSKKFSVLTAYGAIGYNNAKSEFNIKGTYNISTVNAGIPGVPYFIDLDSPFTIQGSDFKTFKYDANGVRMTVGLRLKLGPITLHSDYTVQRTNVLTFGLGFSVKE